MPLYCTAILETRYSASLADCFFTPRKRLSLWFRGFNTAKTRMLGLQTTGMEFASEMIVRSVLAAFSIAEVPITYSDGRSRPPQLRTWRMAGVISNSS